MVRLLGKKLSDRMQRCVWKALSTMSKPAWSISELLTLRYLKSCLDSTQLDRLPSSLSLYAQQGWHRKIGNSVAALVDGLVPCISRANIRDFRRLTSFASQNLSTMLWSISCLTRNHDSCDLCLRNVPIPTRVLAHIEPAETADTLCQVFGFEMFLCKSMVLMFSPF